MNYLKITKETGYEDRTVEEVTTFVFSKEEATELIRVEMERVFRAMEKRDPHYWTYFTIQTITDEEDN